MREETVFIMPSTMGRAIAAVLFIGTAACAVHEAEPAFRASVLIDDRGISIPLPPPSLYDEPEQEVEVEGEIVGLDEAGEALVLRIVDNSGQADLDVPLAAGTTHFFAEGLAIDLTDNCLEAWLEDAAGSEGEHQLFHAAIQNSGEAVVVVEGCDQ